jgi:hypothetical protein
MNRYTLPIIAILAALVLFVAGVYAERYSIKQPATKPEMSAQKFRFSEQCPDGLRVDYENTFRLPKSVVCQKAVGE